ncbi:MAG: hypothetical protein HKN84_00305 [Gammaproteobacteria bacterium]|nr:hypothetical protein [Gammaproteobacteria bacterium]
MLLSKEDSTVNLISAWRAGAICVGEEWLESHVIISAQTIIRDWAVDTPGALQPSDLDPAVAMKPEIVLVGTGAQLILPDTNLMQLLGQRGIGVEIMDTPAACRTYNVLAHEQREVVAALFAPTRAG